MDDPTIETELGIPIPGKILPESEWARTAIKRLPPPEEGPLNWQSIFGRKAPVVLDLGCGNGRFTLLSALNRPSVDHVAIDVLPAVVRYATRRANQRGLQNVRVAVKDARTFLQSYVPPGSIAEIHLYHPQPFEGPKSAHLWLVRPGFLADVYRSLQFGGLFVIQTDNRDYWNEIRRITPPFFDLEEQDRPWPDSPEGRTRREIVAQSQGLPIFRAIGTRRDDVDLREARRISESRRSRPPRSRGRS